MTFGPRLSARALVSAMRHQHWLTIAIGLTIAARVVVFAASIVWPIPNERGAPVSPLLPQTYFDFEFYLRSLKQYGGSWADILQTFADFYRTPLQNRLGMLISGPVFPALMTAFGFAGGNYLPLAVFYLVLGSVVAAAWLVWLHDMRVGGGWLVVFAVLPNPIWFVLVVSPDLLFAAGFAAFFLAYFSRSTSRTQTIVWITALILVVLTRPNSFSVVLFVALDVSWSFLRERRIAPSRALGLTALLVISGLYLYPYFVAEMSKAGTVLPYFGLTASQYLSGAFSALPHWLDLAVSWVALLGAKLLYLTGLRPSYGVTEPLLVFVRAAQGAVLLPGLVALLLIAPLRERLLVGLYCLPFLLGPSQDRYLLAIYPLLFVYGTRFWSAMARRAVGRHRNPPTTIGAERT